MSAHEEQIDRYKYPRTMHLPWSPGATSDDRYLASLAPFTERTIVVTEKLDGENSTLYADGLHARSIDGRGHPSRSWLKRRHGEIAHLMPPTLRFCGENLFAKHSIYYEALESYFYLFSVWEGERCLSWEETALWAKELSLPLPPVLYEGPWDEALLRGLHQRLDLERQEGYVLRPVDAFSRTDFPQLVGKWVRAHHVQSGKHWMHQQVVPNQLRAPARHDIDGTGAES